MLHYFLTIAAAAPVVQKTRTWLYSLGGLGFIPLGLIDASVVPIPGSMDVLAIVLCARRPELWPYYAFIATLGSVLGALATYRLARKGGEETLARRLSKRNMQKVTEIFQKFGFGAIAVPALLPPPIPMVPFVLAAGAVQYPLRQFIAAITLGRAVRFIFLGYLSARYGRGILSFVSHHDHPVVLIFIGLLAAVIATFIITYEIRKHGRPRSQRQRTQQRSRPQHHSI